MRTLIAVLGWSAVALAADPREVAPDKLEAAMTSSCELAKKSIAKRGAVCADEAKTMAGIDCAVRDQRITVDFLKLNADCVKRQSEPTTEKASPRGASCRAEGEGAPIEFQAEGPAVDCLALLRDKLKASQCEPGKKLSYRLIAKTPKGDDAKPVAFSFNCPKKPTKSP